MTIHSSKPNVLLFFTDDQRFDTIRKLGNSEIVTPHLDALVASGVTFTRAHIPGGTSGAVCMPSRAMLHTGRTLFHIAGEGQTIAADHVMLGEHFQRLGYSCFGTGKWHNGTESYARSFTCGDEIFFGGMNDHWNVPAYHFDPTGAYAQQHPVCVEPFHSNELRYETSDHIHHGKHSTELFVDAAASFLRGRATVEHKEPFFLYVSLMAPHDPRTMPQRYLDMYDPETIALPVNFMPEHPFDHGSRTSRDETLAAHPRDPAEIRRHIAEYYAMITHLDAELGRLLSVLDECGERDNTIIVFAGDNGLALGQHGLMGKQNVYDHSVRVPLIFAGPGVPAGVKSDALVYLLDIFPTLCDLVDSDAPSSVEGQTLRPCFTGNTCRESLYLAFRDCVRGVTNGRHKLIRYRVNGEENDLLFDLDRDPHELDNLAGTPGARAVQDRLLAELNRLRDQWEDTGHQFTSAYWNENQ